MADLKITQLAENLDITATDLLVMIDDVAGTPATKKIVFSTFEGDINHNNLTNTHNLTTDIDHDALLNFVANEHIDWTSNSAGTIHSTNYTNTTYTASTGLTLTGTVFTTNDGQINHNSLSNTHNLTTDINHDALLNFVANEHIDWTASGAGTIHSTNYTDTNTTYTASTGLTLTGTVFTTNDGQINHNSLSNTHNLTTDIDHNSLTNTHNLTTDIDHDALTNFVANEHIDWTAISAGTINATNYTNTTYSAGTGITLTGTTFSTNDSAIDHDSLDNVHQDVNTTASPSFVSALLPFTNLGNLGATETVNYNTYSNARGTLDSAVTITISNVTAGQRCGLTLYYSGAQRAITWAGVDYWVGGVPTAPSAGEVLVVTFINDGSKVIGSGELAEEVVA